MIKLTLYYINPTVSALTRFMSGVPFAHTSGDKDWREITKHMNGTWERCGFKCHLCPFDFLSIYVQPYKLAIVSVNVSCVQSCQNYECWVICRKNYILKCLLFPLGLRTTAHIWLQQRYWHNLEDNIKHTRQQMHNMKKSEAKLYVLPKFKIIYTLGVHYPYLPFRPPNALANTTWNEECLCLFCSPCQMARITIML